jgi:hypothetical protein
MALDRTSGYDMLVQISENEINDQLATAFLSGSIIPSSMIIPINSGGVIGEISLNFNTPIADLDRPRPRMGLTIPFRNSQLQITAPINEKLAPLSGTITIVDSIQMIVQGSNQFASMDFNSGAPDVAVTFDTTSQAILAPALAVAGLTLAQAQNMMAGMVIQQLQNAIGRIDLTSKIPVKDDADPTTIFDIDVTTVNDVTAVDRDCITFGIRMANDSGGNINGVTSCFIPAGSQSLVMMSNLWLLARVMRPRVAESFSLKESDFDPPLLLNHPVPAPGGRGILTYLEARVEGNRIRVGGQATDSGTGWSAVANFGFFIDIALSGGSLTVTATTPEVDTDVDIAWWVWLLSLGLGGWIGGVVGAIVAAIVLVIVKAIAEGIVSNMISGSIGGSLGGLPTVPLGPIGSSLGLSEVILDDLELRCSIVRSLSVPVKSSGSYSSLVGFTVDLDTGTIRNNIIPETDLVWDPLKGLTTNGPSGLSITGSSFGALTPVEISRLPLSMHEIPLSLFSGDPEFPIYIVFGIRTTAGRLAKVRAWRFPREGAALNLDWVTYDTPTPRLDIAANWTVIERGEVTEFIRPDCSFCRSSPVRWCGLFEAVPKLMTFPIDYQWCLCGVVLEEDEGSVDSIYGLLTYKLNGRRLLIETTEIGQSVNCELCVSAIDARGLEQFTCIKLSKPGIDTQCRKCRPVATNLKVEVIAAEPQLSTWRPLIAEELNLQGQPIQQSDQEVIG